MLNPCMRALGPLLLAGAGLAGAGALAGQEIHRERGLTGGTTAVTVVGARYGRGGLHKTLYGDRYRDLWATPVRLEVLDLHAFAGGLTPVRRGGSGQTISLHLDGADGRRYVIRSIDKNLHVPADLQNTFAEEQLQDLKIHAFHPAAALMVAPLLQAAGILHATPRMVILPDDPALGEFREDYAGLIGMIEERPNEGPDGTPGFAGSSRVVGTERLFEILDDAPTERVDRRAFLRARLMDLFLGDRDRHVDQWRWARFERDGAPVWLTIPRDRDEAFVANDGVFWWLIQQYVPRFTSFRADYPYIPGLAENGWDLDRRMLAGLEGSAWDSVATALQATLTDSVIADAVHRAPPEYYPSRGPTLEVQLRRRRDRLVDAARTYYAFLSHQVEINSTDAPEDLQVTVRDDGGVRVTIRVRADIDVPASRRVYLDRLFVPGETRDVRIYLHGGDDRVVVRGAGPSPMTIRIIGGGGDDRFADSSAAGAAHIEFHDGRGHNTFLGNGCTRIDRRRSIRPQPTTPGPHEYVLDFGRTSIPLPVLAFNDDFGAVLGMGIQRTWYDFRRVPYRHRFTIQGGVSTTGRFVFEYRSEFPQVSPGISGTLHAAVSGIDRTRFFGFGNATPVNPVIGAGGEGEATRLTQYRYTVDPALHITAGAHASVSTGPFLRVTDTDADPGRILTPAAYGAGRFVEFGWQAGVRVDTRDHTAWPTSGIHVEGGGRVFPALFDVTDLRGELLGSVSVYASAPAQVPLRPTLALRASGVKTWGRLPFQDAAYLGGGGSLRGYERQRFAGDASLLANAEVRMALGDMYLLFPMEVGVFGLADAGRVYVDGASPGGWHTAAGGGIWFAPVRRAYTMSLAIAGSGEEVALYFRSGFLF